MTDKVLKKLSRKELLEILVEQSKENDKLRAQLKEAQDKLNDRNIMLKEAGTLAEASVRINRVFESAETAAQQYLDNAQRMSREAEELLDQITSILSTAQQGRILREGLKTTIIGRPNVGKSSLLNRLLGEEKAIVTDIEGTTRDIVEDYVNVRGVPLKLIDTAGIRETDDAVEKIGVERSRQAIKEADLILFVLDQSQALNPTDHDLMKLTQDENRILVLNKSDLETAVSLEEIKDLAGNSPVISTSMTNQSGIDDLEEAIAQLFFQGETIEKDANYVSNTRHISLLKETQQSLEDVITGLEMGMPVDLVQIDMTHAWETLGEITGETMQDELLNELFSSFCLGK